MNIQPPVHAQVPAVAHHAGHGLNLRCFALPVRRLALVPTSGRGDAAVRRYRLARLRLEDREVARSERFAHLKRSHD